MTRKYDCIVIGTGGMGSAAAMFAAGRGWSTLGLDRFPPGHSRGSSHGQTRIIRQAYFEHPDYVPLVLDSYDLWDEIEQQSGQSLLERTGLLQVGDPDGPIIGGVQASATRHDLALRGYELAELREQFPLFHFDEGTVGLYEEVAGYLQVEKCVEAIAALARDAGAELIDGVVVESIDSSAGLVVVNTDQGAFSADRAIITAGAWACDLLRHLPVSLKVVAKHQHWFGIKDERASLSAGCPVFFFETGDGYFYGFPDIDGRGNKMAEHSGGLPVGDPLEVDRQLDQTDLHRVQEFAQQHFNTPRPIHADHSVCMYTMSPDEHFMVDVLEDRPNIAFACGMSGHGFKFAPVIGQALVNMVEGTHRPDMDFLRISRFNTDDQPTPLQSIE
ncbi:MAG: N-methyl-L-tryptophan oxidase [Pirellulaceae bacterium]